VPPPVVLMRISGIRMRREAMKLLTPTRVLSALVGIVALILLAFVPEHGLADRVAAAAFAVLTLAVACGFTEAVLSRRGVPEIQTAPPRVSLHWWLFGSLVVLGSGLAVNTWFHPGTTLATGDITPPNGIAWLGRIFDPWTWTGSNLGEPSQLPLLLPWAAVLAVVHVVGGDPGFAQRAWYTLLFVGSGLSAFALMTSLRFEPLPALIGAVVYLVNPFVVSTIGTNPVYLAALFLLAATSAVLMSVGLGRMRIRWAVVLLVSASPIFGYTDSNPPLVGMVAAGMLAAPLIVAWLAGWTAAGRCLIALAVAVPLMLIASSYWLVPAVLHLSVVANGQLASVTSWSWTEARATLRNAFWLNSIWTWSFAEYTPYANTYDAPPLSVLKFMLPAIAFGALALGSFSAAPDTKRATQVHLRLAIVASASALLILFLSTGTRPPGNLIFNPLYRLPFGWLLREPTRFVMMAALAYASLIAVVVQNAQNGLGRNPFDRFGVATDQYLGIGAAGIALAVAIPLGFPVLTGAVAPDARPTLPGSHVTVPSYWPQMEQKVDSQPGPGAVLVLPPDDFYQMPYKWNYYGTDGFVVDMFQRHVIVPNAQGYSPANGELLTAVDLATSAILRRDWASTATLLKMLDAQYVLVRGDIDQSFPNRHIVSPNALNDGLVTAPDITLVTQVGSLSLYRFDDTVSEEEIATNYVLVRDPSPDLTALFSLPAGTAIVTDDAAHPLEPQTQAAQELLVMHNSFSDGWQGPPGSRHVLVDGMLNGWLMPRGSPAFMPTYSATFVIGLSRWLSLAAALTALLAPVWIEATLRLRARRRKRPMAEAR
jgi:hypothetical protein